MTRMKHFIMNYNLDEAAYDGNIGFEEMVMFYQKADKTEITKLERLIANDDWKSFKDLIQRVTGVRLKG